MSQERSSEPRLMNHEYDGIREYDNPLPSWWTGIFIVTILFSVGYWIYYHGGGSGKSEIEAYQEELAEFAASYAAQAGNAAQIDENTLAVLSHDSGALASGQAVFNKHCVACHGPEGGGTVGPNLTDLFQIHGSTRLDIYNTIRTGVPEKGMISWEKMLKPDELKQVAAVVSSMRGKHVAGGKAKEGAEVPAFK